MNKFLFLFFLLCSIAGIHAQNHPMATVITPDTADTRNINTEPRIQIVRTVWEAPAQVTTGDRVVLTLRVSAAAVSQPSAGSQPASSQRQPQLPPSAFFMPEVPKGVLLSSTALSAQERTSGIALRMTLIPLTPGTFHLPVRFLFHQNVRYELPALNIRVIGR